MEAEGPSETSGQPYTTQIDITTVDHNFLCILDNLMQHISA